MKVFEKMIKMISDINVRLQTIEYLIVHKEVANIQEAGEALKFFTEIRDNRVKEYNEEINRK